MTNKNRIKRLEELVYTLADRVQTLELTECPYRCRDSLNLEDYIEGIFIKE